MPSKLIFDSFGADLEVVWQTVQEDLLPLQEAIARMVEEMG
ncbi:MAG: hypothetical protein ABSD48_21015 [Armatimonadota bacterium]|jgi:uncharacterized protein with HEPN domain